MTMTRRERLMATLRGRSVDRPAVSFYEIGGWKMDANDDEFTVWNDPSWRPLVEMANRETDLIRMVGAGWKGGSDNGLGELTTRENWSEANARFSRTTIRAGKRTLTSLTRRDKDTQTTWTLEHLLKSIEDLEAYLQLPEPVIGQVDVSGILAEEKDLGDSGIVSIEFGDPICSAAGLFSMEDYTIIAFTEGKLFHQLLERHARALFPQCQLYEEYVVRYTGEIVKTIQKYGGYSRIHSHGRLRGILPHIAKMGPAGLDPLEPPPQGDMELREIKEAIGSDTVLMGNIEAADIENLPSDGFEKKVLTALRQGTAGGGRGFILHPSACPYGRTITAQTMSNYETMIRLAKNWAG